MLNWIKNNKTKLILGVLLLVALIASQTMPARHFGVSQKELIIGFVGTAEAATADYVCDGVDDDVQWQDAIDDLPAGGGKLVALAGSYDFDNTVSRAIDNVVIEGVGYASYFANDSSTPLFSAGSQDRWVFRDLRTDAGGITVSSATHWMMENVWLGSTYYTYRVDSDIDAASIRVPTGRATTVFIAASDASDESIAQADYICDGTADDVQIQAAIDALKAASGGAVVLSEGNYDISTTVTILDVDIILEGVSQAAKLTLANGVNGSVIEIGDTTVTADRSGVRNLYIDGNKANQSAGDGIYLRGAPGHTCYYCLVEDCSVVSCYDNGIRTTGSCDHTHIVRNSIYDCGDSGINNVTSFAKIIGNSSESNGQNGMYDSGNHCFISSNNCHNNSQSSSGTYDGMRFYNADNCIITGNICIDMQGTPTQRYGISLNNSGCDNDIVTSNSLYVNQTGGLNDAGTGTVSANNVVS